MNIYRIPDSALPTPTQMLAAGDDPGDDDKPPLMGDAIMIEVEFKVPPGFTPGTGIVHYTDPE